MGGSRPAKFCAESLWPVWASWVRIPLPAPITAKFIKNEELVGKLNLLKNSRDFEAYLMRTKIRYTLICELCNSNRTNIVNEIFSSSVSNKK